MTDLSTLAGTLLTNFTTVRLRRCEQLWTWPVPDPSLRLHCKLLQITLRCQMLTLRCNRQYLRQRLLDDGYRAFFDQLEGDGPDGWRLHFFCLDPSAAAILYDAGLGECSPCAPVSLVPVEFVMSRLSQLDQCGRLSRPNDWWWWHD
jgi:hypothetical protein